MVPACPTCTCVAPEKMKGTNPPAQLISSLVVPHFKAYSWWQANSPFIQLEKPLSSLSMDLQRAKLCKLGWPSWPSVNGYLQTMWRGCLYFRALNSAQVATVYNPMPDTLPKLFFHKKRELSDTWIRLTCNASKGLDSISVCLMPHHTNTTLNPLCLWQHSLHNQSWILYLLSTLLAHKTSQRQETDYLH